MCMSPVSIKVPENTLKGIFPVNQEYIQVPCGKCAECRKSHAQMWAVRCMCEYDSLPKEVKGRCWFLTITYNDKFNTGVLNAKHITRFINSLRHKYKGHKIKYFYCGEYGSKTYRPHYHMIIYDLPINDLVFYKQNYVKDNLYTSKYLEDLWGMGYVVVGQLTLKSANYVARYSLKKNDTDCFQRCSQGIGKKYFLNNYRDIMANNYIAVVSGGKLRKQKIPKYFLKLLRKEIGDEAYSSYVKWKRDTFTFPYMLNIMRKIKDRKPVDFNPRAAMLGIIPTPVKLSQEAKRLLKQALTSFQDFRDY